MDEEDGERRVRPKPSGEGAVVEVDRLRNLPDSLLHQILLKLPTKDVVKCSVLSRRWRNLWRYVPGLDLECSAFMVRKFDDSSDLNNLLGFVYRFLGFNNESCLREFKLTVDCYEAFEVGTAHFTHWINTVVERKVQHLHVLDNNWGMKAAVIRIPGTVYSCESLVSLILCHVHLPNPQFVYLPSLKDIDLNDIALDDGFAFEMLISGCPVLESLSLVCVRYGLQNLQVCSQSLLSFTYITDNVAYFTVVVNAPRLEYLRLWDKLTESFIIENHGSLVKADIDTNFDLSLDNESDLYDLPKRHMIRNFLVGISSVKDMSLSSSTLKIIYYYSRCEKLPLFHNISLLRVEFTNYKWGMLPIFLESCPNLRSLVMEISSRHCSKDVVCILPGPHRCLTSLEYVKIVKPIAEKVTEINLKLVSYFLENSTILKKLTLCLGNLKEKEEAVILRKLLAIPRLSASCQVFVL